MGLSLNRKLALVLITLAFIAFLFSFLFPNGFKNINEKPNYISVYQLAEKIKNQAPMHVIDLRSKEDFLSFHIATSKNLSIDDWFLSLETFNDSLVFYSGDDYLTRRLWVRLPQIIKERSKILYGGIQDWYDYLLYPKLPMNYKEKDSLSIEHIKSLNKFYGGKLEFDNHSEILKYYHLDLSKERWINLKRKENLVHKGC